MPFALRPTLRLFAAIAVTVGIAMGVTADMSAASPKRKRTSRQPARSMETIQKEQDRTQRKISETSTRLNTTGKELKRQLNSLNSLNADIRQQDAAVRQLRSRIDSIGAQITTTSDSIAVLEHDLDGLRAAYAKALRGLQPSAGDMNALSFIFSSGSFREAYSRMRYLSRFSEWRKRKVADIDESIGRISERRQHLTGLRHSQDQAFRQAEDARRTLAQKQSESEKLVTSLRRQDSQLRAELAKQKRQARELDRELDRIIAAEQARIAREEAAARKREQAANKAKSKGSKGSSGKNDEPSARDIASARARTQSAASTSASQLSGSFTSNKGRLLFPVGGRYKIVRQFGRQPHPTQRHVTIDNSGIDIEVSRGSTARAVFEGTVSAIFRQDGFHTIVMLRHGKYLTIYAGLASTSVRQGEKVKTGQTLGTIYSDPADSDRTLLHFEVRDERRKLNPSAWVR